MAPKPDSPVEEEDAFNFITDYIRRGRSGPYSNYGYDLTISNIMYAYLKGERGISEHDAQSLLRDLSPPFYAAAWELCRRGILRPGVSRYGEQVTDRGSGGDGYALTPFGRQWLSESEGRYDYVPVEPARFGKLLDQFGDRFGPGFRQRAQESVRCFGANAFLACCAMSGAAAESIMLALATARIGDEAKVLSIYLTANGRSRIEKQLVGGQTEQLQREFRGYTILLKYWRDIASHGTASLIESDEAYTSMALLLRFAHFSHDNWSRLTSNP